MSLPIQFETRASGKLLLTGEYFVLDGATALALPVRYGQRLEVSPARPSGLFAWNSRDENGKPWFSVEYELPYLSVLETSDRSIAEMLASIIRECQRQNPSFLSGLEGLEVNTQSDFPREWGLGTSSTLIAAIAKWAGVNPYPVLASTFGGSGYDLACAYATTPLLYRLDGEIPVIRPVSFNPDFSDRLFFVYLEKKQNSREGIARYRERSRDIKGYLPEVSILTERILNAETLEEFGALLREHETLIGEALAFQPVKNRLFPDFEGEIKSLGAWGGDFALVTSPGKEEETRAYFASRGYNTMLRWNEMVID